MSRLRELRLKNNMTQEELAKKINATGWNTTPKKHTRPKVMQTETKLLKQRLGADVKITGDENSGKIILKYQSYAELKNILRSMGIK